MNKYQTLLSIMCIVITSVIMYFINKISGIVILIVGVVLIMYIERRSSPKQKVILILIVIVVVIIIGGIGGYIYRKRLRAQNTKLRKKLDNMNNKLKTLEQTKSSLNKKLKFLEQKNKGFDNVNKNLSNIPIYYINLNKSKDRLDNIEKQVDLYKIKNIHRIEAVDGSELENKVEGTYKQFNYNIEEISKKYSFGELGCALSHLIAIKTAYDKGHKYALILEDDIYLGLIPFWDKTLQQLIDKAPKDWGILKTYTPIVILSIDTYKPCTEKDYGTVSYIINRETMKKVVDKFFQGLNNISIKNCNRIMSDFLLYENVPWKVYTTKPLFTTNNSLINSTIHTSHTNMHLERSNNHLSLYLQKDLLDLLPENLRNIEIDDVKLSLCIPCYHGHIQHLYTLITSIDKQSVLPDEIVISLSSVDKKTANEVLDNIKEMTIVPITLIDTEKQQYAGTNRNVCIENSKYDIISFIDADDLMHYQRVEIIKRIMSSNPELLSLFHVYKDKKVLSYPKKYEHILGYNIYKMNKNHLDDTTGALKSKFRIHNGHITIRKKLCNTVQYTTLPRAQDARFNRDILKYIPVDENTMMHINLPLSDYLQENSSKTIGLKYYDAYKFTTL